MFRLIVALMITLPCLVLAQDQSWPVYENTYVNDYANIIDEDAETRIRKQLEVLRDETGVEATVLTIYTRWGYQTSGSIEEFATGLFNHWGIGNAEKNDGVLILVVSEDREMRIELGSGYGTGYNREAQDIIDNVFLPAFRGGDMQTGIEQGTDATLTRIARAHATGQPAPERPDGGGGGVLGWVIGVLVALGMGTLIFGRRIRDRLSRCPECGQRGLHTVRHVLEQATKTSKGHGERIVSCSHCSYRSVTPYTISRISTSSGSSSSGGSFGGGSSSGGGASGRW